MTLFQVCSTFKTYNDYITPPKVWDMVIPYLPQDKIIWMPFYCEGSCGEYLTKKGFRVHHSPNEDFYEHDHGDICCDNPPYSFQHKQDIIIRLKKLNKPFMLIIPTTSIQTKYFQKLHDEHTQLLIPSCKYNFIKKSEQSLEQTKNCPFYTLWICWRMNFSKDIIVI